MNIEESLTNLREYVDRDKTYQLYKKNKNAIFTDFEKFCISHCEDIENVLERIDTEYHSLEGTIDRLEWELELKEKQNQAMTEIATDYLKYNVTLKRKLEKRSKTINAMAEQLAGLAIYDIATNDTNILADKKEVIKYFERKVEDESI